MATIGSGSALENELVAPPLVAPPPVNCMSTIGPGPVINSEATELVKPTPSAFEMAEPVPHSTQSLMTLAQYQEDNPSQPIIRESGLVENLEVNTISPPALGFATEVSSSPERQNIRRRITPSTSVVPLTGLVTIKPTTSIAEVFKPTQLHPLPYFGPVNRRHPPTRDLPVRPTTTIAVVSKPMVTGRKPTPVAAVWTKAAVPEREELHEERMLKRYHEEREANDGRIMKKFYEEMEVKSVRKPCSGGVPKSTVVKHRLTPSESLQQRTRVWVESTLEK